MMRTLHMTITTTQLKSQRRVEIRNLAEKHPETKWALKNQLSMAPKEENAVRHRVRCAYCS